MFVYQYAIAGIDGSAGGFHSIVLDALNPDNIFKRAVAGDIITSAIVISSSNETYPVGSDVRSAFCTPLCQSVDNAANFGVIVAGADLTDTIILLTLMRDQ